MDGWLRKPRGGGSDGLEDLPRGDAALAYGVSERGSSQKGNAL
jgi:hypothetical protein